MPGILNRAYAGFTALAALVAGKNPERHRLAEWQQLLHEQAEASTAANTDAAASATGTGNQVLSTPTFAAHIATVCIAVDQIVA